MSLIAIIGSLFNYIQAYKIFKTKSVNDLSVLAFSISTFTAANWLVYGLITLNHPLVVSGAANLVGSLIILFGIYLYKNRK